MAFVTPIQNTGRAAAELEDDMSWNLLVFSLIGLFAGAGARLFNPDRRPRKILATLALGTAGAVLGGLISWLMWAPEETAVHTGALLLSFLGAGLGLGFWRGVAYARSLRGRT